MAHIDCHSYLTGRDVKYPLIGVKLKHKETQEDYGAACSSDNRSYLNTSPDEIRNPIVTGPPYGYREPAIERQIHRTTGFDDRGTLESEYENHNTGVNPIITSSTYDVNEFEAGVNTRDLFETDTVKIVLEVHKCKVSDIATYNESVKEQAWIKLDNKNMEVIYRVHIKYILKVNNSTIGYYDMGASTNRTYPITFSISTELWCIKDFNPKYKSQKGYSGSFRWDLDFSNGADFNGIYVEGVKSQNKHDFVGASFTMLCSECWSNIYTAGTGRYEHFKITKDNVKIKNSELRSLTSKAGILYYRNMIKTDPNKFIVLNTKTKTSNYNTAPPNQIEWANNVLITDEYELKSDTNETGWSVFNTMNFTVTSILMPCVNPSTFEPVDYKTEGMFISLTNNILEGPAPDQEPDEEPLDPETVEPADNPETEYTPPLQEAFEDFQYRGSDTISGLEPNYNLFRPSYSNYIFPKYYRDSITGDSDWESAIAFIQEACNPSAFELWGASFKLITGHPTPGEIISRVYYLPFEYSEIRGTDSAGFYFSAPIYGPIGPVTLGVKTHSEDPSNTGEPIESNVHYYQQIVNRFKTINLGQVTIDRVFNNFLDYSEVNYTLNLPYGAGQVELDPDRLFFNDASVGNVKLTGVIDFDTGELTIIIQLNGQRYYETTVNVAIDRLASVADNMAAPLAIAKASMVAGAAAYGVARGMKPSDSIPTSSNNIEPTNNYKSWYSQMPDDDLMEYGLNLIPQKRQNSITQRQNLITQRR